jgi:hypothetical protein
VRAAGEKEKEKIKKEYEDSIYALNTLMEHLHRMFVRFLKSYTKPLIKNISSYILLFIFTFLDSKLFTFLDSKLFAQDGNSIYSTKNR